MQIEGDLLTETINAGTGTASSKTSIVNYDGPKLQFLPLSPSVVSLLP